MTRRRHNSGTGHGRSLWPVLLLLFAAVLTPTSCVLWFMSQAVRNEHFAVRQKLADAYHGRLVDAQAKIDAFWTARADALAHPADDEAPGETFARLVKADLADSVILYDEHGWARYPAGPLIPDFLVGAPLEDQPAWQRAAELEYEQSAPAEAAAAYGQIADQAGDDATLAARALLAQARCLVKAGQTPPAVKILAGKLSAQRYRSATDAQGRVIQCSAKLLTLTLVKDRARPEFIAAADSLLRQVSDYSDATLPAGQRRFLMAELRTLLPGSPPPPMLAAEELAGQYLGDGPPGPPPQAGQLVCDTRTGLWCLAAADRSVVAIFRQPHMLAMMQSLIHAEIALRDVDVQLVPASTRAGPDSPFITLPAGRFLPDWQLALTLQGPDPFAAAVHRQVVAYFWTGGVGVLLIAILAILVARSISRQIRLTRLKNDLLATVSHELKTPLASMRVLIDTLGEGRCRDASQAQEYYGLIAKENERLSRLIDNFLTFSRMERNKRAFDFAELPPAEIVSSAVEAVRDRFAAPHCRLEVEIAPHLPAVLGDRDALISVVLNLLDNAYKYSGPRKHVAIRAYARDGQVCLAVRDNGIGLSRRSMRRVFDRFYQVDRTLTRSVGGCGLGLSIIKFIVDAHDGTVSVASELGQGSTFTVTLPANGAHAG